MRQRKSLPNEKETKMNKTIQLNERELSAIINAMKTLNAENLEPLIQKLENY